MIVAYTCVTGGYDEIAKVIASEPCADRQVIFTDVVKSPELRRGWELLPLVYRHPVCPRRTARWHKLSDHCLFPAATYTIWADGSQQWKKGVSAAGLLDDIPDVQNMKLATFKHPDRLCAYTERDKCEQLRKDDSHLMQSQMLKYRLEGFPAFYGLVETACVVRKNCPEVANFNRAWWGEIEKYSFRDQLSFNYVCWKQNFRYHIIPGSRENSKYFIFHAHK